MTPKLVFYRLGQLLLTIVVVILLALLALYFLLPSQINGRIDQAVAADRDNPVVSFVEKNGQLPEPVERLRTTLSADPRPVKGITMSLVGRIKLPGSESWNDIEGRQYISATKPGFLWNVRMTIGPLWVEIQDHYQNGKGRIYSRGFSILPLLDEQNIPELSITQLVRWSGLAAMVPQALIDNPNVEWSPIDAHSALAVVTDAGQTARHVFFFDDEGRVVRSESEDRYELYEGKGYQPTGSIMHRVDYQTIDGVPVPMTSRIIRIEEGNPIEFLHETFSDIEVIR